MQAAQSIFGLFLGSSVESPKISNNGNLFMAIGVGLFATGFYMCASTIISSGATNKLIATIAGIWAVKQGLNNYFGSDSKSFNRNKGYVREDLIIEEKINPKNNQKIKESEKKIEELNKKNPIKSKKKKKKVSAGIPEISGKKNVKKPSINEGNSSSFDIEQASVPQASGITDNALNSVVSPKDNNETVQVATSPKKKAFSLTNNQANLDVIAEEMQNNQGAGSSSSVEFIPQPTKSVTPSFVNRKLVSPSLIAKATGKSGSSANSQALRSKLFGTSSISEKLIQNSQLPKIVKVEDEKVEESTTLLNEALDVAKVSNSDNKVKNVVEAVGTYGGYAHTAVRYLGEHKKQAIIIGAATAAIVGVGVVAYNGGFQNLLKEQEFNEKSGIEKYTTELNALKNKLSSKQVSEVCEEKEGLNDEVESKLKLKEKVNEEKELDEVKEVMEIVLPSLEEPVVLDPAEAKLIDKLCGIYNKHLLNAFDNYKGERCTFDDYAFQTMVNDIKTSKPATIEQLVKALTEQDKKEHDLWRVF